MHFFLGTNGPNGFFSYFDSLIDYATAKDVTLIKGGPGCGKSTYMRTVAAACDNREYIHCSSDPQSLDGIVFPNHGVALVDATAPHVCEPKLAGVVDTYVNLGLYVNREALLEKREELAELTAASKACFATAAKWIRSARAINDLSFDRVVNSGMLTRISARARALCSREIPAVKRHAIAPVKRFLSSITPEGYIVRFDTVSENFKRVIALDDNYGLASFMLTPIAKHAAANGYKTYVCYCPLQPESRIEHVLIPELGLAFVTNSRVLPYTEAATRHIRLDALISKELVRLNRAHLRFLAKTCDSCIGEAVVQLKTAKELHDKIEEIYNPFIDFKAINALAKEKAAYLKKIIS